MRKLRIGVDASAVVAAVALVSFGCGSATLHTDGGSGGNQPGTDGGAGYGGAAGTATGTGGHAGTGGSAGAGGAGTGGTAGAGGVGGGGGGSACAIPCAATAYCAGGTCKSRFTEFTIGTGSDPGYITTGADGNLWFTTGIDTGGVASGNLGRLTPSGTSTLFPILSAVENPHNLTVSSTGIVSGPDNNIWFAAVGGDGKAYISSATSSGVVTNYLFAMTSPRPGRVTVGPDGNIWATITFSSPQSGSNTFEVCTTTGSISEKTVQGSPDPYGIVATTNPNDIGRLTLAGGLTEFSASSYGWNITVGADSNLWFTEGANNIGRSTPNGTVVEFPVPTASSSPWDIIKGPDGNVWFTETGATNVGSITPGGKITEFPTPAPPYGITTGPDGNIWFTEPAAGKVVRFIVP
jgi:virginiamycin B lyase